MTSQRARETSPLDGEGHGTGHRPKIRGGNERLPDVAWWTVEVEEKAGRIERSDAYDLYFPILGKGRALCKHPGRYGEL